MICFRASFQNDISVHVIQIQLTAQTPKTFWVLSENGLALTFHKQSALFQVGTPKSFFI